MSYQYRPALEDDLAEMVARTTLGPDPREIAATAAARDPHVLVLFAPPGYGKATVVSAYARHIGQLTACELPATGGGADLARAVLDALLARQGARATHSAADRLAQRRENAAATFRESLRREWAVDHGADVFALDDPSGTLATPAGIDVFSELVAAAPARRRLVVSTRSALPPALTQLIGRNRTVTIGAQDLALRADDVDRLARSAEIAPEAAEAVYGLSRGWPLVARLLLQLWRPESAEELFDAAAALPHEMLLAFAAHRTIAGSSPRVRDALTVAMLLRGATHLDLVRVLGDDCDDAVFARMTKLPFVETSGGRSAVHREIASLLYDRFEPLVKRLYERTAQVLTGDGAYVDAARIALDAGDVERAAAIVDAAPPYTVATVPLGEYERIIDRIDRIDRNLITRFPNLWIATIPYRSFSVDPAVYIREAETVYYCLPGSAGPDQRAAILMLLASAYVNVGRTADADQAIDEALHGFARESGSARASILNFAAALRGIEGRFTTARALAAEAARISNDTFGENQRLHYIDCHEATYRGKHDRFMVIIDELVRRRTREDMPLYLAYAAANGAIFSWAAGDDAAYQRYLTVLEDAVTPGLEAGFVPIIDAARGRPIRIGDDYPFLETAAIAQLYRLDAAVSRDEALEAARAAARAADRRHDPFLQILAHVAIFVLDEKARPRERAALAAVVAPIESPELHAAVAGILSGGSAGMLEPFVTRRVRHERTRREPRLAIELLAGRVSKDGMLVRLTDKEFEFLALLASTRGMLSRERIGESLWDHLDPGEWANNFKVTLYRIRNKLAVRDVVLADEGRYRLAPTIEVDLRHAETLVRERTGLALDDATREQFRLIVEAFAAGAATRYDRFVWAQSLLARIADVSCAAGIALANDAWRRGRLDDALRYAADVSAADPFNEQAAETAIRVLIDRHDMDGARREFQRYAGALASGLGAAPSASLAELIRQRS
jgi:DNA-binding SARP family transcriptional activator